MHVVFLLSNEVRTTADNPIKGHISAAFRRGEVFEEFVLLLDNDMFKKPRRPFSESLKTLTVTLSEMELLGFLDTLLSNKTTNYMEPILNT